MAERRGTVGRSKAPSWTKEETKSFLLGGQRPASEADAYLAGEWIEVASSNVATIRYDAEDKAIHVRFHGGDHWKYSPFGPKKALELLQADSKGTWVWTNIRVRGKGGDGHHRCDAVQIS